MSREYCFKFKCASHGKCELCRNGECSRCGWLEDGRCLKRAEQNCYNKHRVKRPPQSWMYVEAENEQR